MKDFRNLSGTSFGSLSSRINRLSETEVNNEIGIRLEGEDLTVYIYGEERIQALIDFATGALERSRAKLLAPDAWRGADDPNMQKPLTGGE